MNNNTKAAWKLLKKDDRRNLARAGEVRKSTKAKVARGGKDERTNNNQS